MSVTPRLLKHQLASSIPTPPISQLHTFSIVVRTHAHGTLVPPCARVTYFYMQSPSFKQELAAVSTLGESAPVGVDMQ
ncbi:hypothetical protein HYPSUDRAFT_210164 [Hypholoma sublateritium FD-334 SS-4]|uniref:Uncharacterized protein n=1 Tax=Hypholoma sublateritium (strain FD-334 SS-4) TaxID=945553 RepID=A0A0D2KDZ6_HYPSF|nr:hypothetical protein HYPSUDRAFT_210164 [Hypholoma sublateritium FD-334 SS-4]